MIKDLANSTAAWAIPWPCLHEFYGIVTHPRVFDPPSAMDIAIGQLEAWLECPGLNLIGEAVSHWPRLAAILGAAKVMGPRVNDARIAAICLQHGIAELWTADRDFSAFPDLRTRNPCVD